VDPFADDARDDPVTTLGKLADLAPSIERGIVRLDAAVAAPGELSAKRVDLPAQYRRAQAASRHRVRGHRLPAAAREIVALDRA
jgi:hypothetical protein